LSTVTIFVVRVLAIHAKGAFMFKLRNILLVGALSTGVAASAHAQSAATDWSGIHAGVTIGELGLATNIAPDYSNGFGYSDSNDGYDQYGGKVHGSGGGAIAGLDLGYNFQLGNIVLGVEGDYSIGSVGNASANTYIPISSNRLNNFTTLRARAGYAFNHTLIYATGGLALAKISNAAVDYYINDSYYNENTSGLRTGYAVGFGLEQALSSNISLKVEALYAAFGRSTAVDQEGDVFKFSNNATVGRISLNYNF